MANGNGKLKLATIIGVVTLIVMAAGWAASYTQVQGRAEAAHLLATDAKNQASINHDCVMRLESDVKYITTVQSEVRVEQKDMHKTLDEIKNIVIQIKNQ